MVIARNVYIDSRRRGRARPVTAGQIDEEQVGAEEPEASFGPDPEIANALRKLERREREAIALRFGGDMRAADIAEVLGVSASNAQQILTRALRRLRDILDG